MVRNKEAWIGGETKVLLTWDFEPDVTWRDDRHLVITINYVSHFGTILHEADGISVIYRLAEENFRKSTDDYERRWKSCCASTEARSRRFTIKIRSAEGTGCAPLGEYRQFKTWAKDQYRKRRFMMLHQAGSRRRTASRWFNSHSFSHSPQVATKFRERDALRTI